MPAFFKNYLGNLCIIIESQNMNKLLREILDAPQNQQQQQKINKSANKQTKLNQNKKTCVNDSLLSYSNIALPAI